MSDNAVITILEKESGKEVTPRREDTIILDVAEDGNATLTWYVSFSDKDEVPKVGNHIEAYYKYPNGITSPIFKGKVKSISGSSMRVTAEGEQC